MTVGAMNLGTIIGSLPTDSVTIERYIVGAYVNGVYQPASPATFDVDAIVQPVTGRDLQLLPEALRSEETISLFTTEQLRTTEETTVSDADVVQWQGRQYEVKIVFDWSTQAGFWKSLAVKIR